MEKKGDSRVQWQDGVGNILIHAGEDRATGNITTLRVGDVDWTWVLAIVGFLTLIVLSLCLLSKLRVSTFTRRAKRKSRKAKKVKIQIDDTKKDEKNTDSTDVESGKQQLVIEEKTKTLLSLIDAALQGTPLLQATRGQPRATPSPASARPLRSGASLDSIDGFDSHTLSNRQGSDVSLALSLVMDSHMTKPIFVSKFKYPVEGSSKT